MGVAQATSNADAATGASRASQSTWVL